MSGRHEPDKWLEVIKTRNDIDHPAVQAAIAVIMDYLYGEGTDNEYTAIIDAYYKSL